jgi:aconitate hydratase
MSVMTTTSIDTLNTRRSLTADGQSYEYFSLSAAAEQVGDISRLPFSLKVLMENLLRHQDNRSVTVEDITKFKEWLTTRGKASAEIAFRPARVLTHDFSGIPAIVDLAAMRDAMIKLGGDAGRINPISPVDLVIDHSVMIDAAGDQSAFAKNIQLEFERNQERFEFLRWGQSAFNNFRVVPPGTGICHQVNLEYLAKTVWTAIEGGKTVAYPDTLVGTDSHTTMVNSLAVLGWGVGGIEAEAAMLGQPIALIIPEVIGFKLTGKLREGATATDLVLRVVEMLRKKGVVEKFVEFYGDSLDDLPLADRATIANMAPEYGATCGFFPIDSEVIRYLTFTGRAKDQIALVEAYAKAQGMWRERGSPIPVFTDTIELDMGTVEPALAGPKRPQDRVLLSNAASAFKKFESDAGGGKVISIEGSDYSIEPGHVTLAAITSCTNTSNPPLLITAGLLAKKANELGLKTKPWVRTSFSPGSKVVQDYLVTSGLQEHLNALGFNIVAFGCATCLGNSGAFEPAIAEAIDRGNILVGAVVSSNRNFEGRVHPQVRANYLASPPLVIAYSLAGSMKIDLTKEALGQDRQGNDVFLKDIWPSSQEVNQLLEASLTPSMFTERYSDVFEGPEQWKDIRATNSLTYKWSDSSTYIQKPPYFEGISAEPDELHDITGARLLALLGDSITTDHISPASTIKSNSPAGEFLLSHQVRPQDFNSFGARRGNHHIMMRGTFGNSQIRNELVPGQQGGLTKHQPSGILMPIFDAAMRYEDEGVPLIVVAGKEYGTGSSRDWAAKGVRLLGVKAVIAESFERIHRSNLVGMGVLPLVFLDGQNRQSLKLNGDEVFDITGITTDISPRMTLNCSITFADGSRKAIILLCRIDTFDEVEQYKNGGIMQLVLRKVLKEA